MLSIQSTSHYYYSNNNKVTNHPKPSCVCSSSKHHHSHSKILRHPHHYDRRRRSCHRHRVYSSSTCVYHLSSNNSQSNNTILNNNDTTTTASTTSYNDDDDDDDTGNGDDENDKIAIAMSGGVDSSVVAYLLSQQFPNHQLIGIHMSNWDFHDEQGGGGGGGSENRSNHDDRNHRRGKTTTTNTNSTTSGTCWEQDWKDARSVADQLDIDIRHVSFESEYWNDVFSPYCDRIERSLTPNPDVDCNRHIKFGVLKDFLYERHGIQRLATGHYARIWTNHRGSISTATKTTIKNNMEDSDSNKAGMPHYLKNALQDENLIRSGLVDYLVRPNQPILMSALDRSKDQSYFLSGVPLMALSNVMFPLGDLYKNEKQQNNDNSRNENNDSGNISRNTNRISDETTTDCNQIRSVRQIASDAMLPNCTKRDSMGICFVGKRKHGEFINEYIAPPELSSSSQSSLPLSESLSRDNSEFQLINIEDGTCVGTFDPVSNPSLLYATAGQGAKISGASQKWFVVQARDRDSNHILVCPGTHHPALYADRLYIDFNTMNWLGGSSSSDNDKDSGDPQSQPSSMMPPPPLPLGVKCRIRHLQPLVDCEIRLETEEDSVTDQKRRSHSRYVVDLKVPLRGIAPGQICSFYIGGENNDLICLGGGPIQERGQSFWERQLNLPGHLHPSGHNDLSNRRHTHDMAPNKIEFT